MEVDVDAVTGLPKRIDHVRRNVLVEPSANVVANTLVDASNSIALKSIPAPQAAGPYRASANGAQLVGGVAADVRPALGPPEEQLQVRLERDAQAAEGMDADSRRLHARSAGVGEGHRDQLRLGLGLVIGEPGRLPYEPAGAHDRDVAVDQRV